MPRYFLILFFLCCKLFVVAQSRSVFKSDTFHLNGHIQGADSSTPILKIVYNTPYGSQEQVVVGLDSTGHFSAVVPLFNPQELMLIVDQALIYLYAIPGKTLNFKVPATELRQMKTADEVINFHVTRHVISFSGTAAGINSNYQNYMYRLNKVINPMTSREDNGLNADEYLSWRVQKMYEQLDTLRSLRKQMLPLFYTRTLNYIRYSAGADVLACWIKKRNQQQELSASYQSFIASLPVNNDEAILTTKYYEFINNYLVYLQVKGGLGVDVHALSYIARQVDKGTGHNMLLDNEAQDSLHRGLPLHPSTLHYLEQLPGNLPLAKRLAVLSYELTRSMSNAMPDKTRLLSSSADTTSDILQQLGAEYKGNVVYVDFWGPWCAPCMEEMKEEPALKKVFEGKPVIFLYLAVHTDQESWEKAIKREQIQGEHYRLSEKEFDQLNKRINITSFPRYLLIDKSGTIRHVNAPRPDNPKVLIDVINKLLN